MVYYWLSWLAIVAITFFFSNDRYSKHLYLWLLLLNVIFINTQVELSHFTFTLPFIYSFIIFFGLIIVKTMPYFNYFLLFCLIFFYLGLRFVLISSPIWLFINQYLIITILLFALLILSIRNQKERTYILVLSCLTGEFLYAYHVKGLGWDVVIGVPELFLSLYLIIFISSLINFLSTVAQSSHT